IEHQMNLMYETLDIHQDNLPLKSSLNIYQKNALRIDWNEILKPSNDVYILGNPPFVGKQEQNNEQKDDMNIVFRGYDKIGTLDYVSAWYKKALDYIIGTEIECAFVSTNSICQGEQPPILWRILQENGIIINFAHQSFKWSNEAKNNAGVNVVIIGFSMFESNKKELFTYETLNSSPKCNTVKNINCYLVDFDDVIIDKRNKPLCNVPPMVLGSIPRDGGNLILSSKEKEELIQNEPLSKKYVKRLISTKEYLNNEKRYCLWLVDALPSDLKSMPTVLDRINKVKEFRLNSTREQTRKLAAYPSKFAEIRQPKTDYILIPLTTSENREYLPIGFVDKNIIANNSASFIESDDKFLFGVITSKMHMVWMEYVCGRLESRYRYSNTLVYNNFPFPHEVSEKEKNNVKKQVDNILNIRNFYSEETLADLYDPILMPDDLKKAHHELDILIDKLYRKKPFLDNNERMVFLLKEYLRLS
uniref:type IIL restriction-modification enzyme MmeI n=1 Tax=Methanobrevibacter sp. TaxID=66852 RepID=UPI0038643E58